MLGVVANELKPVYLLTGSDRPKIARPLHRLRERIGEDATEHLDAHETSGEDAVAACNSLGLFVGEGRLVIVEDVDRWKAADVKDVAAYLRHPRPRPFWRSSAPSQGRLALGKAVAKAGEVLAST